MMLGRARVSRPSRVGRCFDAALLVAGALLLARLAWLGAADLPPVTDVRADPAFSHPAAPSQAAPAQHWVAASSANGTQRKPWHPPLRRPGRIGGGRRAQGRQRGAAAFTPEATAAAATQRPERRVPAECRDFLAFAAAPEQRAREAGRWDAAEPAVEWSDAEAGAENAVAAGWAADVAADEAANAAEFVGDDHCTVERVHLRDLSLTAFLDRYHNRRPVAIQVRRAAGDRVPVPPAATHELTAAALGQFQAATRRATLLYCFGDVDVLAVNGTRHAGAGDATMRLRFHELVTRHLPLHRNRRVENQLGPGFYFDGESHATAHGFSNNGEYEGFAGSWLPLLTAFPKPKQLIQGTENQRGATLAFGVGGSGSGVGFHQHGPVFLALLHGRKRWWLRDPALGRPRFTTGASTVAWFRRTWLRAMGGGSGAVPTGYDDCVQRPGEVLYLPDRWWHATLNVGDTVSMGTFFVD